MEKRMIEWCKASFKGVGQVMFQPSAVAGALMLAGILVGGLSIGGSGRMLVFMGALVALILATFGAYLWRVNGRADGLQGFNAVLVGCAVFTFLNAGAGAWFLLAGAALLTLPVKRWLDALFGGSSYTLPFVMCTWLALAGGRVAGIVTPYIPEDIAEPMPVSAVGLVVGVLKGISEVFLIDSWLTGLLFLAALAVSHVKAAAWALIGSAAGLLLALCAGCPADEITAGLWGFSPALTAIAVGTVVPGLHRRWLWVAAFVAITFGVQYFCAPLLAAAGLPVLTFPFCVATILLNYRKQ